MKNVASLAFSALAGLSLVAAAPVEVRKRGEMATVWDIVVETTVIYTTVYLSPGEPVPTGAAAANAGRPGPAVTTVANIPASDPTRAPAKAPAPAPAAAPAPQAPAPAPAASAAPAPVAPAPVAPAPVAPAPAPAAPAPATTAAAAPPPPSPAAPAPAPASSSSSSGGSSGGSLLPGYSSMLPGASNSYMCSESSPCGTPQASGAEASFYSMDAAGVQGIGSCGANHDGTSEDFVAIDATIMGSLSSGIPMNPLCGKTVTVKNTQTGKSATGTVVDTCPGCKTSYGIDLSQHLFDQMADESQGVFPVEWWFNDL